MYVFEEYVFLSFFYPIMETGIVNWAIIFTVQKHLIDHEYNENFLKDLHIEGNIFQPEYALTFSNINLYLYYAQAVLNMAIIAALYQKNSSRNYDEIEMFQARKRCQVNYLLAASFSLNGFNIGILYYLWQFLDDEKIRDLRLMPEIGLGFNQWYRLCSNIFDARRAFWIIAIVFCVVLMVFLGLTYSFIYLFIAYERCQGRIYGAPLLHQRRHGQGGRRRSS